MLNLLVTNKPFYDHSYCINPLLIYLNTHINNIWIDESPDKRILENISLFFNNHQICLTSANNPPCWMSSNDFIHIQLENKGATIEGNGVENGIANTRTFWNNNTDLSLYEIIYSVVDFIFYVLNN